MNAINLSAGIRPSSCHQPNSLITSPDELNRRSEWFIDPTRPIEDNLGPHIVVVDDFYADPEAIRELALGKQFEFYSPLSEDQIGREAAAECAGLPGTWRSTAVVVHKGRKVSRPFFGYRYNPSSLRERMSQTVGEPVVEKTWEHEGDYWNGAFHLIDGDWTSERGAIHHHYKAGDVLPRGWSGLVYLSPGAPASSGTSIWRERATGLCVAGVGAKFDADVSNFDLALLVENRFNRLVLFRENVLHRAEHGFGQGTSARLTQTFFFQTSRSGPGVDR